MLPRLMLHIESVSERLRLRLAEYNLAFATLAGGLILLGGSTFDLPVYVVIKQIMSQATLAWIMVTIGIARLAVLIINGAMPRGSPHFRSGFASLSGMLWTILLVGFVSHQPPVLITAFLAAAIPTELAVAFRAAQDAREEDDKCRERANGKPR